MAVVRVCCFEAVGANLGAPEDPGHQFCEGFAGVFAICWALSNAYSTIFR
jgi:hypothetical protein